FRLRLVARPLPWPVRRIEMEADQERLVGLRIGIYRVDGAGTELVGEIADLMDLDVLVPQIMLLTPVDVREIVHCLAADTEEVVVTALERTEIRQNAQMPLADQSSAVSRLLQQRRQGGMLGRKADLRVANQRLLEPQPQSILVAAGDQRETRGG